MAETGIKISQLQNVVPSNNGSDYTIIVKDGFTRRTYLSSLNDFFTTGSVGHTAEEIGDLKKQINSLDKKSSELTLSAKNNSSNISINSQSITNLTNQIAQTETTVQSRINTIDSKVNGFQQTMNAIAVLTSSQDTLNSLTSVIDLLAGEDGKASLSNMAIEIQNLKTEHDEIETRIKDEIDPALRISEKLAANELYSPYAHNSLSVEIIEGLSSTYYKDSNRPFNLPKNTLISITPDSGGGTSTIISCQDDQLISCRTDPNDSNVIDESTISAIPWPGEETFSDINAIPIRVGEFKNDEGDLVFNAYVSGNSDVDIYLAKGVAISAGNNSGLLMNASIDDSNVFKIKTGSKDPDDTDLELVASKRVRGGRTIRFKFEDIGTNLSLKTDNLIGAIACKQLPSETMDPFQLKILSAWSEGNNGGATKTTIAYSYWGGVTGDNYGLSVGYRTAGTDGSYAWISTFNDNSPQTLYADSLMMPSEMEINPSTPINANTTIILSAINNTNGIETAESNTYTISEYSND